MNDEDFYRIEPPIERGLEYYREFILDILRVCPQIRETNVLYRLKESFPEFQYRRVQFYRYMKKLREQTGLDIYKDKDRLRTVQETPEPGYEAQVDFGQYRMKDMYGIWRRLYFFCMVLSYSKMRFVYFSSEPFNAGTAIEAHRFAFKYFGGRTQTIMYDLDKCFVVSENLGNIIFVKEFEEYVRQAGYSVVLCKPRDPQTKGRVEQLVGYVKQAFFEGRECCGIDQLNSAALEWLDNHANVRVSPLTGKSARELYKTESKFLIPVKPIDRWSQQIIYTVSDCNFLKYKQNAYELPRGELKRGDKVRIEEDSGCIAVYDAVTDLFLCKHEIPLTTGIVVKLETNNDVGTVSTDGLKRLFNYKPLVLDFINALEETNSQYANKQCSRIMRLVNYYKKDEMLEAFEYCLTAGKCNCMEFISYLIYRYGHERLKGLIYQSLLYNYQKRAREIREAHHGGN
jgi:transposase